MSYSCIVQEEKLTNVCLFNDFPDFPAAKQVLLLSNVLVTTALVTCLLQYHVRAC